ncbi:MAG: hypothetical protein QW412_00300 [Candidatus Aenigmatarchaeota archaeon]
MVKKFLAIFGMFLFSFIFYLFLSNPTAMSISQTNPSFWLPLFISMALLVLLLIVLITDRRKLAEKIGSLKKTVLKESRQQTL